MDQGGSLGTPNMVLGQPVWSPEALQKRPTSKCFYRSPDSTVVYFARHISILEQESRRLVFNSILFGALAAEFSVESKNINRFAGERDDFF